MKKLIYVLLAALTLAACSLDDPKIVLKDQIVLKKLSLNALDQLGKPQQEVSDAVLKLGFNEVVEKKELPASLRLPAYKNEKYTVRTFTYNAPEDMTFDDLIADTLAAEKVRFFNKIADSRKSLHYCLCLLRLGENRSQCARSPLCWTRSVGHQPPLSQFQQQCLFYSRLCRYQRRQIVECRIN